MGKWFMFRKEDGKNSDFVLWCATGNQRYLTISDLHKKADTGKTIGDGNRKDARGRTGTFLFRLMEKDILNIGE